jgi:hypothetical protein
MLYKILGLVLMMPFLAFRCDIGFLCNLIEDAEDAKEKPIYKRIVKIAILLLLFLLIASILGIGIYLLFK